MSLRSQALTIKGEVRITRLPRGVDRLLTPSEHAACVRSRHAEVLVLTTNLVTDIGLEAFAGLFAGGYGGPLIGSTAYTETTIHDPGVSGSFGHTMKLGADPIGSLNAPAPGDTDIEAAAIFQRSVDGVPPMTVTYPSAGRVQFSAVVPQLDFGGTTFTEEGLFSFDGQLLARTTFSQPKTASFALQFDHLLTLGRA